MERHSRWHQRLIELAAMRLVAPLRAREGQSTVEFAIIAAGFMSVTVALVAFWRMLGGGLFVEHALAVASHHVQAIAPATLADIFLY